MVRGADAGAGGRVICCCCNRGMLVLRILCFVFCASRSAFRVPRFAFCSTGARATGAVARARVAGVEAVAVAVSVAEAVRGPCGRAGGVGAVPFGARSNAWSCLIASVMRECGTGDADDAEERRKESPLSRR